MQLDFGNRLHARGPVVLQVADAVFLAFGADTVVEVYGFSDPLLNGEAARAERLKLANVVAAGLAVAGERPYLLKIFSRLIHNIPLPMGAERNLCRLVPM